MKRQRDFAVAARRRLAGAALCFALACQPPAQQDVGLEAGAVAAARPSVLWISVDTLRADHLSVYGYPHPTSPELDAWARRFAVVFENAVVQAPWTLPSHVSMLTGLDATRHGVNYARAVVPPALTTIAERLGAAGYATAAVTGGGWFHPRFGLPQGFDRYRNWPQEEASELELASGIERALDDLAAMSRPAFLFFHTFEVHDFRSREPAARSSPADHRSDARRRYDRSIARTDAGLRRLLDAVAPERGRWLVIFTSDHGEGFGDDRAAGHGYLYDNNLRVPLIVELPDGRGAGRRVAHQTRLIDIVPTILEAAGLPPAPGLDGASLLAAIDGRERPPPVAASYAPEGHHGLALRVGNRWKYTLRNSAWAGFHGQQSLYDLRADPAERNDLGADHPEAVRLRAAARRILDEIPGLRLRFANALPDPLVFVISAGGGLIDRHAVTASSLPCECLTRTGIDRFTVDVPPGVGFEILLEHWDGGELEIEAEAPAAFRTALDLAELDAPFALRWRGSTWAVDIPEPAVATGIEIRRRGLSISEEGSPIDRDPEVRRQLRALGYLD